MSNGKKIILASASPRRRELLNLIGLPFKVDAGDYEEDMKAGGNPGRLAKFLSLQKARSVAVKHPDAIIIAADTFIVFRGHLLGKPHTRVEARRMLLMLSGRTHTVITGFTLLDTASGKRLSRAVETKVRMKRLLKSEIDAYVESGEPLDKAGAYAIQGRGAALIKGIEGDYFNVIGLPLCSLAEALKKFGISLF